MSVLDAFPDAWREADAYAAAQPGFGPGISVGPGEAFGSAWRSAAGTFRMMRLAESRRQHLADYIEKFNAVAGFRPVNPEGEVSASGIYRAYDGLKAAYRKFKAEKPGIDLPEPPDEDAAHAFALEEERALVAADANVRRRPQGLLSRIASFGGDVAGAAVDPVNLSAMVLGGPWAGAVVGGALRQIAVTAFRESVIGAATQSVISTATFATNRQVDPEYSVSDALAEIGLAGVGGAILGGGVKGLAIGWNRLRTGRWPRYVRDAGNVVEREAIASPGPYASAGLPGELAHLRNLRSAEDALIAGRPVELPRDLFSENGWRPSRVYDAEGRSVAVKYEVVEASTLIASHTDEFLPDPRYPAELQPRDRARGLSQEQVAGIASRLQPERLGPSVDAGDGAPIVGPDGIVESGNGRVLALRRAYAQGGPQAASYRNFLAAQGFEVAGVNAPVLIARRVSDLSPADRLAFTTAANRAGVLRLSAPEQAIADARLIDRGMLEQIADADLAGADNRALVRSFLAKLPRGEQGGLVDARGRVSAEGVRRLQAALVARAYGDPMLLARAVEATDSNLKTIAGALVDVAGSWARLRDAVAAGEVPPGMDLTPDLLAAVALVAKARDGGAKLGDLVRQAEMFEAPSPMTKALLAALFRDPDLTQPASRKSIAAALGSYVDEARKNTSAARLFGDPLAEGDVLAASLAKVGREDLQAAAEAASTPAAAAERLADTRTDDAVLLELDRLLAERADLAVPLSSADGGDAVTLLPARALLQKADNDIFEARRIAECAVGMVA